MRTWALVLAVAAAVLCAGAALAAEGGADGGREVGVSEAATYSISYELNGGTMEDAPDFYVKGCYMDLPVPTRDGYVFAGWYTDPGFEYPQGAVLQSTRGRLILYAKWIQGDELGAGWSSEASGSFRMYGVEYAVSGSSTTSYVAEADGMLLVKRSLDYVLSYGDGESTESETSYYEWTSGITSGYTYTGRAYDGDVPLTVWTDGTRTITVRDMTVVVSMTTRFSGGSIVETLTGEHGGAREASFTPDVTAEYPLDVEGVASTPLGADVTLRATGDCFAGWYLNGTLVSVDRECTFRLLTPDDEILAASSVMFVAVFDGSEIASYGYSGAETVDADGDPAGPLGSLEPGLYVCTLRGDVTSTARFLVDCSRTFSVEWEYGGETYSWSTEILYSQVYAYVYAFGDLPRYNTMSQAQIEAFCTWYDPVLQDLVSYLEGFRGGMTDLEYAQFVLCMVQSIPYATDEDVHGTEEYWSFPIETLWEGCGDCEDVSILYATLMGMSGYRVAFAVFQDHTMAAVSVDSGGSTVRVDGYDFVLCEATGEGFEVGDTAAGYGPSGVRFSCRLECFPEALTA